MDERIVIESKLGTYYYENGVWWRRPVGQDKKGRPWQRKRATRHQIEIAEILLDGYRRVNLAEAEARADELKKRGRTANAKRHVAGKNKGKPMSAAQKAKMSAVAKTRTGERNPFYGKTHTAEARAKIAEARRSCVGWRHTKETKRKIGAAHKGKTISKEQRQRLSAAHAGKVVSEETRQKMSAAMRGEKNPNYGKTMSWEQRQKISAANKGRTFTAEQRERMAEAQRGRKHSQDVREKISAANAASLQRRRRNYRAFLDVPKFPGGVVGCCGILEEAAVRIIQADPDIREPYYESLVIAYTDEEGVSRHCIPDYTASVSGESAIIEVSAPGYTSPGKKKGRSEALKAFCEANGIRLLRWSRKHLARRCEDLGLDPILESLEQSKIRITLTG
jgi:hypothetical protein